MPFTVTMPKLSPTMEEGAIAAWHKKIGDRVEPGDLLIEVSTDKATVEYNAIDGGYLRKILVNEGDIIQVNQPIAIFTEAKDESIEGYATAGAAPEKAKEEPKKEKEVVKEQAPSEALQTETRVLASPLAKKLAKQQGIELNQVQGSGPRGRIMKRDLEKASIPSRKAPKGPVGAFIEEPLSPMRKVIAQRLQEAKATIPHFYVSQAIDALPLVNFREQMRNLDLKVTFNDCVVKAVALSLVKHPIVNSGFNASAFKTIRFQTVDVSVAVNLPQGLITPIIRYADTKSLSEIGDEIRSLAARAKDGKLQENEYKGGSFTVSNLGMYGVQDFSAIINPPQAGILSVSAILDVPVVKNNAIVPGKVMNVTLSVDHRVIDGVAAAEFLVTLKTYLENPVALLL